MIYKRYFCKQWYIKLEQILEIIGEYANYRAVFRFFFFWQAENIGEYANYQIKSGAQVIQVFDSWAGKYF